MQRDKEKGVKCSGCGSSNWIGAGWTWRDGAKNVHMHRCLDCGKKFVVKKDDTK